MLDVIVTRMGIFAFILTFTIYSFLVKYLSSTTVEWYGGKQVLFVSLFIQLFLLSLGAYIMFL